jgi:multidrug efflux system membrane fusion protein
MKPWLKWALGAIALALLAAGIWQALSSRKAQQEALATQAAQRSVAVIELAATDLVQVKTRTLSRELAISGTLRAVNSAIVKARVAGELQGLTLREGDAVKAGQIIARVEATESLARTRQAQQQAESAKAQVDIAKRNFANNRSLVDQGFISKTALDSSSASLAAAEANFRAAQAGVDLAVKSLDDTVLRAPIAGLVSQRLAQTGERVAVEARVLEIVDLSRLELEASLSAVDSIDVRVGQSAQLQIEGAPKPVTAKVVRINPAVVAGSRAVLVYLAIDQVEGLRQGLFAQGALGLGQTQALSVPLGAVRTDKPLPYLQLVNQLQIAHQSVELGVRGAAEGQIMVAIKGVPEGATVVSGTLGALPAGTTVKLTSAKP